MRLSPGQVEQVVAVDACLMSHVQVVELEQEQTVRGPPSVAIKCS